MRNTTVGQRTRHRPPAVIATIALLVFLGVSAVFGGIELAFGLWVAEAFPADWLDRLPLVDSWVVPGLVLGIGFGLGSLVAAYGMITRQRWPWLGFAERWTGCHWSWLATVLIGAGQIAWILLELIYLPGWSWLHVVYGSVGVALFLLPMLPSVRRDLRPSWGGARPGEAA